MDKTKAKIQELLPDVMYRELKNGEKLMFSEPEISLAVVLRATEDKWRTKYFASHDFGAGKDKLPEGSLLYTLVSKWNLEKDYDDQSQPTKDFIGSVLGV